MFNAGYAAFFCLFLQAVCVVFTCGRQFQTKDQQFIDSLQQYEFVELKLSDALTDLTAQPVKEKRLLSIYSFQGQTINIHLTLNRNLLSPNFFERHVTKHGYEIVNEAPRNCYFHGHVEGQEGKSVAAISTCDVLEGYFTLQDKTYLIRPVKSLKGEVFHLVFESEHASLPKSTWGHSENENTLTLHDDVMENITVRNHRVRRDVLTETKYVELVLVCDKSEYTKYGSKTSSRAIDAANHIDSTYRFQNIRIILTMVEIWKDADQIVRPNNNDDFLANFIDYKKTVLDANETTKNDHAVLITNTALANNYHGWAGILTICSQRSASLVHDKYSGTSLYGAIVSHELGHSFGFTHIDSNECPCGKTICLMTSQVSYSPLIFSNCTQVKLGEILMRNYGTCLFNQPRKHYQPAKCGNGFVDEGEQCDCGTKKICDLLKNKCCNSKTCKLHAHVNCSDGPCCKNCQLKPSGVTCREKVNDCDLPEYCDGKSPICAPDSYVHNGRTCTVGKEKSLCYLGVCHTYDNQCKLYWGPDATAPKSNCYPRLNVRGDEYGFCKDLGSNAFMKCDLKDVKCGRLQCEITNHTTGARHPVIGHSIKSYRDPDKGICWSASSYLGLDIPVAGMVQTGSMCADHKVCDNNTCVDVNTVYKQPECPNNCSGNGICNNLGHCHCNYGYGCPHCSVKCGSEGGSVDSGNACYCSGQNISTTVSTTQTLTTKKVITTNKTPITTESPGTTRDPTTITTMEISTEPTSRVTEGQNISTTVSTTQTLTTKKVITTNKTPITTESPGTTHDSTTITTATEISTEPTSRVTEGETGESNESNDVVKTVIPSVFGSILLVIVPVLCFIFRKQILRRYRKFKRSRKTCSSSVYLSTQMLRPGEAEGGLDLSSSPEPDNPGVYTGEKNPGFTSISFIPVSKIDSKTVPSSLPTSSLSHDAPPQYSEVPSDQSSQSSSPSRPQMNGQPVSSTLNPTQPEISTAPNPDVKL